ncbi:hypothetical protein R80B4_02852 [Fibrobacteres bacterium R8-0-B4]
MATIIPQQFTDKFIYDEIDRLEDSISKCEGRAVILQECINDAKWDERVAVQNKENKWHQYSRDYGFVAPGILDFDEKNINRIRENRYELGKELDDVNERLRTDKARKRSLERLCSKTEEQRAEEHYQQLLEAKRNAYTEEDYTVLSKKFSEIECYKDAKAQMAECADAAVEARYKQLLLEKEAASTEEEWQDLANRFWKISYYKDGEALAEYCDTKALEVCYKQLILKKEAASTEYEYQYLGEQFDVMVGYKDSRDLARVCYHAAKEARCRRAEQERSKQYDRIVQKMELASTERELQDVAEQFREMNGYKDTAKVATMCDNKRENKERIEAEERKRHRDNEKRKRLFWNIFSNLLGGTIGGTMFAIAFAGSSDFDGPNVILGWWVTFGWVVGIGAFTVGAVSDYGFGDRIKSGCGWGCVGSIVGTIIGGILVAISSMISSIVAGIIVGVVTVALIKKYRY